MDEVYTYLHGTACNRQILFRRKFLGVAPGGEHAGVLSPALPIVNGDVYFGLDSLFETNQEINLFFRLSFFQIARLSN